jgi:general stress protein 26
MASSSDLISKLFEVANKFSVATFVTHDQAGNLHGRPMRILKANSSEGFWLVTAIDTPKVHYLIWLYSYGYAGVGIK